MNSNDLNELYFGLDLKILVTSAVYPIRQLKVLLHISSALPGSTWAGLGRGRIDTKRLSILMIKSAKL